MKLLNRGFCSSKENMTPLEIFRKFKFQNTFALNQRNISFNLKISSRWFQRNQIVTSKNMNLLIQYNLFHLRVLFVEQRKQNRKIVFLIWILNE